jgi:uncharacterized membrane protein YeiH
MLKRALVLLAFTLAPGVTQAQQIYAQTVVGSVPAKVNLSDLVGKCVYTGITALTVGASSGSVVGAPPAAVVGQTYMFHCQGAATTWY